MIETANGVAAPAADAPKLSDRTFEKLVAFAHPRAVYSPPVVAGAYTVITASEVFGGGGFGFGSGTEPAGKQKVAEVPSGDAVGTGGGGGGGFYARPVATIVIGPDGVKVQPIPDATKIVIAVISAWAGIALMAIRMARASKASKASGGRRI